MFFFLRALFQIFNQPQFTHKILIYQILYIFQKTNLQTQEKIRIQHHEHEDELDLQLILHLPLLGRSSSQSLHWDKLCKKVFFRRDRISYILKWGIRVGIMKPLQCSINTNLVTEGREVKVGSHFVNWFVFCVSKETTQDWLFSPNQSE